MRFSCEIQANQSPASFSDEYQGCERAAGPLGWSDPMARAQRMLNTPVSRGLQVEVGREKPFGIGFVTLIQACPLISRLLNSHRPASDSLKSCSAGEHIHLATHAQLERDFFPCHLVR